MLLKWSPLSPQDHLLLRVFRWEKGGKIMGKLLGTSTMCSMCSVFYLLLFLCAGKVTLLPTNAPLFLPRYVPPRQLSWSRTRSTMVMASISLYIYHNLQFVAFFQPTYNLGGASPCSWLVGCSFSIGWLTEGSFPLNRAARCLPCSRP